MEKKFFFLLVFLFYCAGLYSQDSTELYTYQQAYLSAKDDTSRINALRKISNVYNGINNDSAVSFAKKALYSAENIKWTKGIAQNSLNLGVYFMAVSNYDSAIYFETKALEAAKIVGDKNRIALIYINRGSAYTETQQYEKAMVDLTEAMRISEETGNRDREARTSQSICELYMYQRNYGAAKPWAEKALQLQTALGNEEQEAVAEMTLGGIYSTEKNFNQAEAYLLKAIEKAKKANRPNVIIGCCLSLNDVYIQTRRFQKATSIIEEGLFYAQPLHAIDDISSLYLNLGNTFLAAKKYNEALGAHKKGYEVIKEKNEFQQMQYLNLEGMAKSYSALGDFKNAYESALLAAAFKDSALQKEQSKNVLKLQTQFETERKEKENQLLKTQNLASSLQLQRNRGLLIAAAIFILLLGTLLYALYRNRQAKIKNIGILKNLNAQLEQQKEEITRINTILELKALRAQMNPHFIFNCMSSIQECMLTGRIEDANIYLTKLSRLLRMVLNYSDEESITLDKELQMLGLYLQLEKIRLKDNFEYEIEIDDEIASEDLQVPTLILQPFAENAIWHGLVNKADDRLLSIKGNIKNEMLHFTIRDNGIGRNKAKELKPDAVKHHSKGIVLIQKRLDIVRAKTNIVNTGFIIHDLYNEEHAATGTCVEINLPLEVL